MVCIYQIYPLGVVHIAWVTPITWTFGQTVTAAQLNSQIRDNFNETSTAKATTAGGYYVATAANTLAERVIGHAYTFATDTTTSTTYTDLDGGAGPSVTVTTGTKALLWLTVGAQNNTVNASSRIGVDVSGATTVAAVDAACVGNTSATANANVVGAGAFLLVLNAGSNTFTAKYRVTSGTGSFYYRRIIAMGF